MLVARIAEVISAVEPDIVVLQELDQHHSRSWTIDQPHQMAQSWQSRQIICR